MHVQPTTYSTYIHTVLHHDGTQTLPVASHPSGNIILPQICISAAYIQYTTVCVFSNSCVIRRTETLMKMTCCLHTFQSLRTYCITNHCMQTGYHRALETRCSNATSKLFAAQFPQQMCAVGINLLSQYRGINFTRI